MQNLLFLMYFFSFVYFFSLFKFYSIFLCYRTSNADLYQMDFDSKYNESFVMTGNYTNVAVVCLENVSNENIRIAAARKCFHSDLINKSKQNPTQFCSLYSS